mgnify:FL=1
MAKKIIILGGGLSGLAAADKLLDKNFEVLIIEKAPFLGGLASSFSMEDEEIPRFNHHIIKSNAITLEYLQRYDLMGSNKWKRIKMAMALNNNVYGINTPLDLLKFDYLSFFGRMRMGLFGAYLIYLMNPEKIPANLDAESWLLEHAGRENTEKIWHELYGRNKFNISLSRISAKQFAHRLHEKEGYDLFTFPMKGIQGMIDGLEKDVLAKKGRILINSNIIHLDVKSKKIVYSLKNKKISEKYDILINTIPVPELLKFTKNFPKDYEEKIRKLRYIPVVGLCFGTKKFLNDRYYWINIINERIHVIYQHSLIIDKYKSKVAWCVSYGNSEQDLKLGDDEIKAIYLPILKRYFPDMELNWCLVFREKYAEPIYDKDYLSYAPSYKTHVNGFYNSGIQVTFPKIRNMNVALESGIKVVDIIEKDLNELIQRK